MFELLAIILLGVLTRMIFILADSTDKNTYLWFMHIFKTGMKLKNREIPNSVFRGLGGTPPIPHKIFAEIFHEKHWISANMLFNIGADVLAIILVYFHAGYVLKSVPINAEPVLLSLAGWATMLYATSPLLHPINARFSGMGGRTTGNFFCLLHILCLSALLTTGNICWHIGVVLSILLILFSSKFGLQVVLFFSVGISLAFFSFQPMIDVALALLIGLSVPKWGLAKYFYVRKSHLSWYFKNFSGRTADGRNSWRRIIGLPKEFLINPVEASIYLITSVSYFILFYSVPYLALLIYSFIMGQFDPIVLSNIDLRYSIVVTITALIIFTITSLKRFLFIGEAERYFEIALPFSGLLFIALSVEKGAVETIYFMVFVQVCLILFNYMAIMRKEVKTQMCDFIPGELNEVLDFLSRERKRKILCVPTKLSHDLDRLIPGVHLYYFMFCHREPGGLQHILDTHIALDLPSPNLNIMVEKFGIDTLVVEKTALSRYQEYSHDFPIVHLQCIFENDQYAICDLKK